MKNVLIILICAIFGLVSCDPIDRCDYKVVIAYRIQNSTITDTLIIENTTAYGVPTYVLGKNGLEIIVTTGGGSYFHKLIYNGTNPVTVEHFDYTTMRQYKVNKWSGEELH